VVDAGECAKKPSKMTHTEASTIPCSVVTGLMGCEKAGLKKGQKALILGGSGGTGVFAIQLCKAVFECSSVAVTCSAGNSDLCKSLGADQTIDYTKEKWYEVLKGKEIDFIYDTVGGNESWAHAKEVLAKSGHYVTIIGDHPEAKLSGGAFLKIGSEIAGRKIASVFGGSNYDFIASLAASGKDRMLKLAAEWIDAGKIKTTIEQSFKFSESIGALAQLSKGRTKGKLVVLVTA